MLFLKRIYEFFTHLIGNITGQYYFEDFVRVYPDGIAYNRLGIKRQAARRDLNNFLNHQKFYRFAAQFAPDRRIIDIGCGSGHGSEILHNAGARFYYGIDLSQRSIRFARERFGRFGEFHVAGALQTGAPDSSFDMAISNEVLEHLKEYGKQSEAIREMKRVVKNDGLIVIGTPNSEMLKDHGFSFAEMSELLSEFFKQYCLFENALILPDQGKQQWEKRKAAGQTGIVVSENILLDETVLPEGAVPEIKQGLNAGTYPLGDLQINTALLHNTHSWIVVAINSQ